MTGRERLTRLFKMQELDRIPIWLLAPYHRLNCYADIYNIPCYKKVIEYIYRYCDTFDRRGFDTGFCYNAHEGIIYNYEEKNDGGNLLKENTISYKDFKLVKHVSRGKDSTRIKHFVDDIDDLEKILEIPYKQLSPNISPYFIEKEELGDRGLMMIDVGDPLTALSQLMSFEDFSVFSLTDYNKMLQFIDEMYNRVYNLYKYLLERDIGEVFFIVGAEFAGPPIVSPDKFNELSARYVKGLVDLIREYGKWSIVHYHGNLYKVLEGMKSINSDGLHTIEAPPQGNCTITQARQVLEDMILIGNIQYDDLVHCEKEEIEAKVRDAIEEGKSGRFILSPSAGPYEEYITDRTVDNYIAFIEAGIKYGKL